MLLFNWTKIQCNHGHHALKEHIYDSEQLSVIVELDVKVRNYVAKGQNERGQKAHNITQINAYELLVLSKVAL